MSSSALEATAGIVGAPLETEMPTRKKQDFPLTEIRRYLEPGPIVLVSSRWEERTNIMTMG